MSRYRAFWVVVFCLVGLVLAGCGDDEGADAAAGGSSGSKPASSAALDEANKAVEAGYGEGLTEPPPTSGPPAVKGKNVWFVSCGQTYESCVNMTEQFEEAGAALGWKVTVVDGKADPTAAAAAIRQAVAAKADGIGFVNYNCPDIKGSLLAAKKENIPVVAYSGLDCDNPFFEGNQEPLFTASVNVIGDPSLEKYFTNWGKIRAQYIASKLKGKGKLLNVHETTAPALQPAHKAFVAEIERFPDIEVVDVPFTFSQVPNPVGQQLKSAVLANPDANAISTDVDSLFGVGLQAAIQGAGRKFDVVAGAEGNKLNFDLIRKGIQTNSVARADSQVIWGLADTLNRLFSGEDAASLPNQGGGMQIIDNEHNLPAEGEGFLSAVDYKPLYKKIWNAE